METNADPVREVFIVAEMVKHHKDLRGSVIKLIFKKVDVAAINFVPVP